MELKLVTMKVIGIVSYLYLTFAVENSDQAGRYKREEDERWIWGYAEDITIKSIKENQPVQQRQRTTETPESMETTTEFNPCLEPPPVMPDFRKPGQRVSETKCLEYKWDIVRQEIKKKKFDDCIKYMIAHNRYPAIGGYMARPGEFPHMAALGWRAAVGGWIFKCGGSLISERYVLTAAHCSRAAPTDTTVTELEPGLVVLGETNLENVRDDFIPASYSISQIIKHPQYKAPKKYYDIALLKLKETVSFDHSILPACLWSHFDTSPLGNDPTLTGWGVVETASRVTSPTLQVVKVDMIDSGLCDRLLRPNCNRNWCGIQDTQICAGKLEGGHDACQGDSGGPLQLKMNLTTKTGSMYHVVGVTSFGHGCALPDTPGVYTRVSEFIDWIEGIVWRGKP